MFERLKDWWERKTCSHFGRRTIVTISKDPGAMLEVSTTCKKCGEYVMPEVVFSEGWKHEKLMQAKNLRHGQVEVVFDSGVGQ